MSKSSRGAPSQFDILMSDLQSDDDAEMTRDNFELSTAELMDHYSLPVGLSAWMKDKGMGHTVFIKYHTTHE